MLERVALNQTSFKMPGVSPDARGILLGRQGALILPTLDRVVLFFRLLSEELPLDDVLPALKIHQVRSAVDAVEFLLLLHAESSYLLDRYARVAGFCGGTLFTGSGRHFVRYRDRASPLGYDVDIARTETSEFVLYDQSHTQHYNKVKTLPFLRLVLQLSLIKLPGLPEEDPGRDGLWLTAGSGLSRSVLNYLWRHRVKAVVALVSPESALPPDPRQAAERAGIAGQAIQHKGWGDFLLLRTVDLSARLRAVLLTVPGIEAYRALGENYILPLGYRHPFRLESCTSAFDKERFFIFSRQRNACEVLLSPPVLVPIETLIDVQLTADGAAERGGAVPSARTFRSAAQATEVLHVPLRLVPGGGAGQRVRATLVPWQQLGWLKRLVYLLPPTLLADYQVALIEEGLFIVPSQGQGLDGLPIGALFQEIAPSIFVQSGMGFSPRIGADLLREQFGGTEGRTLIFLPGAEPGSCVPIALGQEAFEPLDRRVLAPFQIPNRPPGHAGGKAGDSLRREQPKIELVNDPVGAFPLWGQKVERPRPERGRADDGDDRDR